MSRFVSALVIGALAIFPHCARSQGFSGSFGVGEGKTVTVKQLLPATVNLNQKRIAVEATSVLKGHDELVEILKTKLITMIQGDPRFIVDQANPQTILKFTVTNSYSEPKPYSVGYGQTAQTCQSFEGKLEVSYQALDAVNHAPLDSENLVSAVNREHKQGGGGILHPKLSFGCDKDDKKTLHEAQDSLVDGIVHEMGQRAAPTDESIVVKLPGKKLEQLSKLATAQRWGTVEEEAEKMDPLPKPEEDAYRKYMIGLAKEAQAYDLAREASLREQGKRADISQERAEADFQKAQSLLDDARKLYKDAIQAKPGEKEFLPPDTRMEKAIAVYATIQRHKEEYKNYVEAKRKEDEAKQKEAKLSPPRTGLTQGGGTASAGIAISGTPLDQVIKFCQQNVAVSVTMEYINDPSFLQDAKDSNYSFNVKNDPLLLAANCKDNAPAIQRAMRARLLIRKAAPKAHK